MKCSWIWENNSISSYIWNSFYCRFKDFNINISGYKEIHNDYANEYNESPQNENKLHYGGFKYNIGKYPNYYNNNNKSSYLSKVKTNNNFYTDLKKVYGQNSYSKINYKSERKNNIDIIKKFNIIFAYFNAPIMILSF